MATENQRTDPNRTLDLLWGAQPPATRGPKPGLSIERIVESAIELADADGIAAVSMRRVAERLGVTTMSLYRYVPSKTDLLELMVETAGEVGDVPGHLVGWRDKLRWMAQAIALTYRQRPWALDIPLNAPPMGPNQIRRMEQLLEALDADTDLTGGEMLGLLVVLSGYVRGHSQLAFTMGEVERRTGAPETEWDAAYGRMLTTFVRPDEHPVLARIVAEEKFEGFVEPEDPWLGEEFAFGLEIVLDGIASYLERRGRDS